jgi:hypothetical protein
MNYKIFFHNNITHLYISYHDINMFPLQRTGTNLVNITRPILEYVIM